MLIKCAWALKIIYLRPLIICASISSQLGLLAPLPRKIPWSWPPLHGRNKRKESYLPGFASTSSLTDKWRLPVEWEGNSTASDQRGGAPALTLFLLKETAPFISCFIHELMLCFWQSYDPSYNPEGSLDHQKLLGWKSCVPLRFLPKSNLAYKRGSTLERLTNAGNYLRKVHD